jgi:hypothetical protein
VSYTPQDTRPKPDECDVSWWPEKLHNDYMAQWQAEHSSPCPQRSGADRQTAVFAVPPEHDDVVDHEAFVPSRMFVRASGRKRRIR